MRIKKNISRAVKASLIAIIAIAAQSLNAQTSSDEARLQKLEEDSDLFDGRLNMEGVGVRAGYMVADAIVLNLTYGYAWRIDDSLGTGGTGDIPINPLDQYQLFQADLSVNF